MSDAPLPSSAKPPPTSPVTAALRRAGSIGLRTTTTSRSTPIGSSRRSCPKFRSRVRSRSQPPAADISCANSASAVFASQQSTFNPTKIRWCRTSQSATCDRSYRSPGSIGRSATCPTATRTRWRRTSWRSALGIVAASPFSTRSEWIVARKRCQLVHEHPNFAGILQLTTRPRWSENSPRHNFVWAIWGANRGSPARIRVRYVRSPVAPARSPNRGLSPWIPPDLRHAAHHLPVRHHRQFARFYGVPERLRESGDCGHEIAERLAHAGPEAHMRVSPALHCYLHSQTTKFPPLFVEATREAYRGSASRLSRGSSGSVWSNGAGIGAARKPWPALTDFREDGIYNGAPRFSGICSEFVPRTLSLPRGPPPPSTPCGR